MYLISFSTANASISGSSVVPGLPNTISTPSCLSNSRKARFPDMARKGDLRRVVARMERSEIRGHLLRGCGVPAFRFAPCGLQATGRGEEKKDYRKPALIFSSAAETGHSSFSARPLSGAATVLRL